MIRITQLRLWLLGLYQGKLDNDPGPFSLSAIRNSLGLYKSIHGNTRGFSINDIIVYLGNKNWAINTVFLNSFLKILDPKEGIRSETISQEIERLYSAIYEKDKDVFIAEFNKLLTGDERAPGKIKSYRKAKTRGIKTLYNSVSRYINRIISIVKTGIQKVLEKLKALFIWIKNGVNIIYNELKKIYKLLAAGVNFFFSKRKIISGENQQAILKTDFDFNFDSITTLQISNNEVIDEHIKKCRYQIKILEEVADFVGKAVNIIIKIASGPLGWIKLGIELIKCLADNVFSYNKYSFS